MIGAGLRILVAGAGIGGLGAARALRALGLEPTVAERASLISHQRLCDHRDRTRNLPPALRNLVLRGWGRNIVHANYRLLPELP